MYRSDPSVTGKAHIFALAINSEGTAVIDGRTIKGSQISRWISVKYGHCYVSSSYDVMRLVLGYEPASKRTLDISTHQGVYISVENMLNNPSVLPVGCDDLISFEPIIVNTGFVISNGYAIYTLDQ